MPSKQPHSSEPTQPTRPRKAGAKPAQIPIPTREDFLRDLRKVAPKPGRPTPGEQQSQ